jgi:hypothetical protein
MNIRFWLPAQPIDATQALNLSAGVWNAKVLRGLLGLLALDRHMDRCGR